MPIETLGKWFEDSYSGEGHLTILPWSYNAIVQGTWANNINASPLFQSFWQNSTHADNDEYTHEVYLAKGEYTFCYYVITADDYGILDTEIDGTSIGTIDCYTVGAVWNVRKTITGVAVAQSGLKTISVKVNGKNVGSGDHYLGIISMAIWRTA